MSKSIMTRNRVAFLAFFFLVAVARGGSVVAPLQQPSFADTEASVNFEVPSFEG